MVLFGTSELVPLHLCGSWRLFSHSDRERSKRLRMWSMTFWSVSESVGLAVSGSGASREAERSRAASCWRALRSPLAARSTRWRMAASSLVTTLRRPWRVITTLLSNALRRTVARLREPLRRPLGFPVCPLGKRVDWGGLAYPTWSLILLCYRIFCPITIRFSPYFRGEEKEDQWEGRRW